MQVPQQQQQQQQPQQQQPSFAQLAGAAPGGYEDNQLFSDSLLEFNFFPDNLYPSNPSQVDSGLQTLPYDQMLLSESQLALADLGNDTIAGWTNDMDPTDLIMAMSSRLPTVEQSGSEFSPASDSVLNANRIGDATAQSRSSRKEARQFAKVTWWRPHGLTAIAPGASPSSTSVTCELMEQA